ncbi:MAG: hypothetical protein KAQ68_08800 [Clostridiales bacterium]|nr:hypothetical protein [Clostridiales bacterium]
MKKLVKFEIQRSLKWMAIVILAMLLYYALDLMFNIDISRLDLGLSFLAFMFVPPFTILIINVSNTQSDLMKDTKNLYLSTPYKIDDYAISKMIVVIIQYLIIAIIQYSILILILSEYLVEINESHQIILPIYIWAVSVVSVGVLGNMIGVRVLFKSYLKK